MGFPELYLAIDGYAEANMQEQSKPASRDDVKEFMELYPD